jgi:hypothetical protein
VTARLQHQQPERQLALQLVSHADHGALGHGGVAREHLLHLARGEAMPATLMMSSVRAIT